MLALLPFSPAAQTPGRPVVVWSRAGKHIGARYFRPLDAGFRAAPAAGTQQPTVVFTDTTAPLGQADTWAWNFGDGHGSAAQHPQHTYTTPGVYTVTLTASASGSGESESLALPHAITVTSLLHSHVITYTYDPLQRLTIAAYSTGETYAYQYDAVGNRTVMTRTTPLSGTIVTTHTYDAANRLTARQRSDGHAYTYDWSARGQLLIEWTQGYPVREFTYDAAGQMIRARVFTQTTEFVYNGLGDRIAVDVAGYGTTTYALDYAAGGRILAETTLTETVAYLYGHECLGEQRADDWLYYLPDAEGHVRQGADAAGAVVSTWRFDPDGTVLAGPHGPVSHLICGGVYDWSTGLIYQGGRYFDPALGIWLALLPLAVVQGGRKRKSRRQGALLLCVALLAVGTLAGCEPQNGTGTSTSTPTPTLTCTPNAPLWPSPTPTTTSWPTSTSEQPTATPESPTATPDPNEVLDTVEKRIQAIKQAALAHHGSIPVEVVLAIAGAESGPPYGWSNEQGVHGMPNTDGVMQVTGASGYKSVAAYANTRASIETNIRDAVANLTWNLNTLRSRPWGDYGTTFDDLVNSEIIRTLLHYNAGNWPIELYAAPIRQGTPRYLGRIADSLEAIVPPTFGLEYMNPGLVQELRVAQELVYDEIRKRETP